MDLTLEFYDLQKTLNLICTSIWLLPKMRIKKNIYLIKIHRWKIISNEMDEQ